MKIDTFNRAKYLREKIDHMGVKMTKVKKMKQREDDEDFNECRQLAYDSLNAVKTFF